MELEAGFMVTSSMNTYNQYIMDGSFTIVLLTPPDDYYGGMPQFGFISSIKCKQTVILQNQ